MNWDLPLVLLDGSWGARFNKIYFVRFGLRIGEILNFKWFFVIEHLYKSQKNRFWKEKSLVTFEGLLVNSSMRNWDLPLVLLERSRWTRFNGIYFISFRLKMWEISKFQVIFVTKNSHKLLEPHDWGKNFGSEKIILIKHIKYKRAMSWFLHASISIQSISIYHN
jgi:hypothetical protein